MKDKCTISVYQRNPLAFAVHITWDLLIGCGPIRSVVASLLHRQVMGLGQMRDMESPGYELVSTC